MSIYRRLEKIFGRFQIPNLMKYICAVYIVGFLIQIFSPEFYFYYLDLDPEAILHGHIWRLITFIFYPPSTEPIWLLIAVFVYYSLGTTLERVWGTFSYNLFYFMGVVFLVLSSIIIYLLTGYSIQLYPTYMTFSIFLAYALTFPEATFMLYFFIPLKAKYLALGEVIIYVIQFLISRSLSTRISIALSLLNVWLFFLIINNKYNSGNIFRMKNFRR